MIEKLLPVATLLLGTALGLIASYFSHRQGVNSKLLDQYFEARKLIAKEISPLTNIDLRRAWTKEELQAHWQGIASLFFENFDVLPGPVLEALMLLEICLRNPSAGPIIVRRGNAVRMTPQETVEFVERITAFRNVATAIFMTLQSENEWVRGNQTIKLHARAVLFAMHDFSSLNAMYSLKRALIRRNIVKRSHWKAASRLRDK